MDDNSFTHIEKLIPKTVARQANEANRSRTLLINELLEKRNWPLEGWDDETIMLLIKQLSLMDSNNFLKSCGVGEREARIVSETIANRHFGFGHGIGRSGDLLENQPKAAGSSVLYQLTNSLALHALQTLGVQRTTTCFTVPLATGMSLTLIFLTIRQERPLAKYIVWSRIDQKSCFKSIITAGFEPVIIDPILVGDELQTDVSGIKEAVKRIESKHIACIFTTTSCFAPRACDNIEEIAVISMEYNIPHVINNAYGAQSSKCMHVIQQGARVGRVDAFVQSTDKNFMVPVGGTIIGCFDERFAAKISKCYPGRASSSPIIDLFVTLLSLGSRKYQNMAKDRKLRYQQLKEGLRKVAAKYQERVLETPRNPISIGMTLPKSIDPVKITELGSMLFLRCVSGARVISPVEVKTINEHTFKGWGAHCNEYPVPYLTAAASIGMTSEEVDKFLKRLDKVMKQWGKKGY